MAEVVTFNGSTQIILVNSGTTEIDVERDLYSAWKRWVLVSDNAKYPTAFEALGGNAVGGGRFSPKYFFLLNDWIVKIDGDTVNVGTNLYRKDESFPFIVINNGGVASATSDAQSVKSQTEIELSYNGQVYLDLSGGGETGTADYVGTLARPSNNWIDAKAIADSYNISTFDIGGTLVLSENVSGLEFKSWKDGKIDLNNQLCIATRFRDLKIFGQQNASSLGLFYECRIENVLLLRGILERCKFIPTSPITIGTSVEMFDCKTQVENDYVDFDFSSGGDLFAKDFSGNVNVVNMTNASSMCKMGANTGEIDINASCTAGMVVICGIAIVVENQSGTNVITSGIVSTADNVEKSTDDTYKNMIAVSQI